MAEISKRPLILATGASSGLNDDRIAYLDDLGFWALGTFLDGRLNYAGYSLRWSQ